MKKTKKVVFSSIIAALLIGNSMAYASVDFQYTYKVRDTQKINGFEIRYLKEFEKPKNEMKDLALEEYKNVLDYIEQFFDGNNIDIPVDIDNESFQEYISIFAFPSKNKNVSSEDLIKFVKFMDIYENYDKNQKMMTIAETLSLDSKTVKTQNVETDEIHLLKTLMPIEEKSSTIENDESKDISILASNGYDADDAIDYAREWAYKTNNSDYSYYADYYDVEDPSDDMTDDERPWNDCTNFVSQCLDAGGMEYVKETIITPHNDEENWYYSDSRPSHTWGGAHNFYLHWSERAGVASSSSSLTEGDVVNADFYDDGDIDHTAIITKDTGSSSSDLYLTQHTSDKCEETTLGDWYDSDYIIYGYEMDKADN